MYYTLLVFCLFSVLASYNYYRNWFNPLTLIFSYWAIVIPLTRLRLYGLNIPSRETYQILFIGLLSYYIGVILGREDHGIIREPVSQEKDYTVVPSRIRYMLLYLLCAISLLYYIQQVRIVLPLLLNGRGLDYIRSLATTEEVNELRSSTLTVLIKNFIATPTIYLCIAILPIEIFRGENKRLFLGTVCTMLALWVVTTGGRSIILWVILYFAVVIAYEKTDLRSSIKIRLNWKSGMLLAVALLLLAYLLLKSTYSRKGADVDLVREACVYFVAPVQFLDYQLKAINSYYQNYYAYGCSSFYGLIYPFVFILKYLGFIKSYPEVFSLARELSFTSLQHSVLIGDRFTMNAFATFVFQPYLDGRLFGVVSVCGLFGYVTSRFYSHFARTDDNRYLLLYLLMFQKVVFSFVRFYFTQPGQSICFILALLSIRHTKTNESHLRERVWSHPTVRSNIAEDMRGRY